MTITIKRPRNYIRIFGSNFYDDEGEGEVNEPLATVYSDNEIITHVAMVDYTIIDTPEQAKEMAEAIMIAGLMIEGLTNQEDTSKKANVIYVEPDGKEVKASWSYKRLIRDTESNIVVTVNKKERIRYRFMHFGYRDESLIIYCLPVAW